LNSSARLETRLIRIAALAIAGATGITSFASARQDTVANSAAEAKPLQVGARVPDASIRGLDGKVVRLRSVLRGKPTVLIFYRGGWCPFCNAHLSDLAKIEPEIQNRGYQIIAVSPDVPAELAKMVDKDHLTYRLFSDSTAEAMKKFGVAFRVDDATFSKYRDSYHIDLEKWSGETHHILPVPSVFIVDRAGKLVFVHSNPDYKVRLKGEDVLEAIKSKS